MEKRLALAILLSLVVLTVFQLLQPQPEPSEDQPGLDSVESVEPDFGAGSDPAPVAAPDAVADPTAMLAAEVEREHVVDFGTPGEVGHFRATFTNRGAELVELRTGSYFRRVGLDDAERADPSNWLPLIEDVALGNGERPAGGFAMKALTTAEPLVDVPLGDALWVAEELAGGGIEFRYAGANGVVFIKRFEPVPGTWDLAVTLALESPASLPEGLRPGPIEFAMVAVGTVGVEVDDSFYKQPKAVAVGPASGRSFDIESKNADFGARDLTGVLDVPGPLAAVGGHNKYFAVLLRGADMVGSTALRSAGWRRFDALGLVPPSEADELAGDGSVGPTRAPQGYVVADVQLELRLPEAGQRESWDLRLYAGPKDHGQFLDVAPVHKKVLNSDLSFFSGIGNFLIDVLNVLHAGTGNWGVSIILLTLLIRTILFPLNRRSQTAMARYQAKMKRLQPKLEALKEKFKDQPKELQQAQAKFMQEEGAFPPLGGCLPIFLQMPVFFGLFAALRTSFDLRQAGFVGYIQDLSRPDQLFYHGVDLPLFGEYFNLLPPLMVVMWIWQQRSMPQPSDEQARQMQRIMLFMPVVMGVFLYNYAAGLSLYMVTQSTLGIVEQRVIKKVWPLDDTEQEKKAGKGCAPFAEAVQKAAEQQQVRQKQLEQQKAQLQKKKQQRKKR
ncbi:MAG: membrane protein insertase YidC [Planctomycetota bacterium]